MGRAVVDAASTWLDKRVNVLDCGWIELVDYLGSDERIVEAARQSTTGKSRGMNDKDKKLIHYMMRSGHTSPFEMCELVFKVKLPIFVARQWIRHRTASVNEFSGRYSVFKPEYYIPSWERMKHAGQGKSNLQGSEGLLSDGAVSRITDQMEEETKPIAEHYTQYMEIEGLARELARINQPVSLYTQWMWKIDLHNLLHFLGLRMDEHAQWEFRQYANVIGLIVSDIFPVAWECFEEYKFYARTFSRTEIGQLNKVKDILAAAIALDTSHWNTDMMPISINKALDILKELL